MATPAARKLLPMPQEILVAIIAAGAAIVASVSANVVTAVVSARREKKRLEFEMD